MKKEDKHNLDVLHVTEACGGGVRRHLRLIVPALVNKGFNCAVCGFGQRVEEDFFDDLHYYEQVGCKTEFWPFNHGNLWGVLGFIRHFKKLLREWRPAVIHAHSSMAGFACRAARKALPGVKLVYSPHAFAFHPSLPWYVRHACSTLEKWGAKRTDAYAFVGRSEIQDANKLALPPDLFHLIENGLPESYPQSLYTREEARKALGLNQDELVAVVPCRLARQKGLDQVIEVIARLKDDYAQMKFLFCGEGPEKNALISLAKNLKVADRAVFTGSIDRLNLLIPAFDLAILPSLYEGLSYVLLECLAAGLPLVVSDIMANVPRPELREVLNIFEVGDLDGLSAIIRKTIREPQRAKDRALMGVEFMKSNFTLDNQIQKLANLYQRLR